MTLNEFLVMLPPVLVGLLAVAGVAWQARRDHKAASYLPEGRR